MESDEEKDKENMEAVSFWLLLLLLWLYILTTYDPMLCHYDTCTTKMPVVKVIYHVYDAPGAQFALSS